MIADRGVRIIPSNGAPRFAWSSLRRFSNTHSIQKTIVERFSLENKHYANALKQAEQLSFCLSQAKEYFDAARSSSLATQPVRLYYGCMALALAEILWKGDGNSSIDKLRQTDSHHGLELKLGDLSAVENLGPATQLAVKINNPAKPSGTFVAWQKIARNSSLAGKLTVTDFENGGARNSTGILYTPDDSSVAMIPDKGISFLECLQAIPSFYYFLESSFTNSRLVRCTLSRAVAIKPGMQDISSDTMAVHPLPRNRLDEIADGILFRAIMSEKLTNKDFGHSFIMSLDYPVDLPRGSFQLPEGCTVNSDNTFLRPNDLKITEFGAFYSALYIAGMFCRYFPDIWMKHLDKHSQFSLMVEHLCMDAQERVPLLLLSELDQTLYLLPT